MRDDFKAVDNDPSLHEESQVENLEIDQEALMKEIEEKENIIF
jgi:hypothetical protein